MTVTSVPCQVVRSTTQVYFNIRIDQKRRRAIHFCEQCRYYGRYCDAIHKGIIDVQYHRFDSIENEFFFFFFFIRSSLQVFVDLFRLHWHEFRFHRKFLNHTSILFSKNVIQQNKFNNIFKNKFDRNSPILRPFGL